MDPLTAFTHWGYPAPYRAERPEFFRSATVVPVRTKTGLVAARRGGLAHLENGVAAEYVNGSCTGMGARFLCGGGSNSVAVLPDARAYGGVCVLCVDVAGGPAVYRCFSAAGALLYIGSTGFLMRRISTHVTQTPWWPEVADVRDVRYLTIFEARATERQAILAESPLYNKLPRRQRAA